LPSGAAATGTPAVALNGQGVQTTWTAFLPYQILAVPRGGVAMGPMGPTYVPRRTDLIAAPALFVNRFNIAAGTEVPFWVMQ
jgi:hypothetical protein